MIFPDPLRTRLLLQVDVAGQWMYPRVTIPMMIMMLIFQIVPGETCLAGRVQQAAGMILLW